MRCDVGEVMESSSHSPTFQSLHLRRSSFSNPSVALPTSQLVFQTFRCFTYATAHSSTLLPVTSPTSQLFSNPFVTFLRHSSFSNPSVASPTSQIILRPFFTSLHLRHKLIFQPFRHFTYVTALFPTLPLLHLRHSPFSDPSFASPTSQALHLRRLASRP